MNKNINKIYRGDTWSVELTEEEGTISGNLKILNTNDRRLYNPLFETPDLFLRFSELGLLCWDKTTPLVILKEKIAEFLNKFSYLDNIDSSIYLNEETPIDYFLHQGKIVSQIISIIRINNGDKIFDISLISSRIFDLLKYEYKISQKIKNIPIHERYRFRFQEFEKMLKEENQDKKQGTINKWLIDEIKHQLELAPCINQIESSSSKNDYHLVLKPESLKAAIWFQVADIFTSKKLIKDCSYLLCKKLYTTTRAQRSYCCSTCQTRAKSYRAYHHLSAESPKIINQIERKKVSPEIKEHPQQELEVIRKKVVAKHEEFSSVPEYDADFGFFENEESEKRILGE